MTDAPLARTPEPPYWAVIFTSVRTPEDTEGYGRMSEAMNALARQQPGFLGVESARDESTGITVSYWASEEAIRAWKHIAAHQIAQRSGRERWYADYVLRVAKVDRAYTLATSPREGLQSK